jgi:hypothetical protein
MGNFTRESKNMNCGVGDFGVHRFDHSVKLQVGGFDGNLVLVRFSEYGKLHPCMREELLFPWEMPKKKVKKVKKKETVPRNDDDDEDLE